MTSALRPVLIVGSSGHAKVVIDTIERGNNMRVVGLLDSRRTAGESTLGYQVLGSDADIARIAADRRVGEIVVAVGDNWQRHAIVERIRKLSPGILFPSVIDPSVRTGRGSIIGPGTVAVAGAIVNADARVGQFCILNTRSSLDHDCTLGQFASLGPGATVGGRCNIGEFSAVGIGATVSNGCDIGSHVVVGAGAVVVRSLAERCVAVGVPARSVRSRDPGEPYM